MVDDDTEDQHAPHLPTKASDTSLTHTSSALVERGLALARTIAPLKLSKIRRFVATGGSITRVRAVPERNWVLAVCGNRTIHRWNASNGAEDLQVSIPPNWRSLSCCELAPGGDVAVIGYANELAVLDLGSGEVIHKWVAKDLAAARILPGCIHSVSFTSSGLAATGGCCHYDACVLSIRNGSLIARCRLYESEELQILDSLVAISGDSSRILLAPQGCADVRLANIAEQRVSRRFRNRTCNPVAVALSECGTRAGVAGTGGVQVWDADEAREIVWTEWTFEEGATVAFSPDVRTVLVSERDRLVLRDFAGRREIAVATSCSVGSIGFSPCDQYVVSGHDDGSVQLWSLT